MALTNGENEHICVSLYGKREIPSNYYFLKMLFLIKCYQRYQPFLTILPIYSNFD